MRFVRIAWDILTFRACVRASEPDCIVGVGDVAATTWNGKAVVARFNDA